MTSKDPAEVYYDSEFALKFYDSMWGGDSDIHIGLHDVFDDFHDACKATPEWVVENINADDFPFMLDLGSGFGGPMRLWSSLGFVPVGLNISAAQNQIAVDRGWELDFPTFVVKGSFEEAPFSDGQFDVICSMDSFVHSQQKEKVLKEAFRMLKPGGMLIFTDLMVAPDALAEKVAPLLKRINLPSMETPDSYHALGAEAGFVDQVFRDRSWCAAMHYRKLHTALTEKLNSPAGLTVEEDEMRRGCDLWATAGEEGTLVWGCMEMQKPESA